MTLTVGNPSGFGGGWRGNETGFSPNTLVLPS